MVRTDIPLCVLELCDFWKFFFSVMESCYMCVILTAKVQIMLPVLIIKLLKTCIFMCDHVGNHR